MASRVLWAILMRFYPEQKVNKHSIRSCRCEGRYRTMDSQNMMHNLSLFQTTMSCHKTCS